MTTIRFAPLTIWPSARTKGRKNGTFRVDYNTLLCQLQDELDCIGTTQAIISLALTSADIRVRDNMPRASARPTDPGVVLNIKCRQGDLQFACDTYTDWQDNLRAISLTMNALRAVDRYGCAKQAQQYTGWKALPPGPQEIAVSAHNDEMAARVLSATSGYATADILRDSMRCKDAYRKAAKATHPDVTGGNGSKFRQVQEAYEQLKARHGIA